MTALPEIARHMNRQIELGKGIRFSADQVAALVVIGVNDLVQRKAAEDLRLKCQNRNAQNRSINGAATGFIIEPTARTLKSSSMPSMFEESTANEALARAQAMLRPQSSR